MFYHMRVVSTSYTTIYMDFYFKPYIYIYMHLADYCMMTFIHVTHIFKICLFETNVIIVID